MSAMPQAQDSTVRMEPPVREIAGVYVASTSLDPATAEIMADPEACSKILRRRSRGMSDAVFADELDESSIQWAPAED